MCNCAKDLNENLKQHNYRLTRNLLQGDEAPVLIEMHKIEPKKRSPNTSMVASYCPFCGKKYPERASRGVLRPARASKTA